jgi:transcriptional regulator
MGSRVRKRLGEAAIMGGMYVPAHFQATEAEILSLLQSITAVDLISPSPDGLVATFLPMLYDAPSHSLLGHVARNNTHWSMADGTESLVILHGPDAYISPNWYPAKAEHGRVVPTWNYVTAHVYGQVTAHQDPEWLRSLVTRLTERHEGSMPSPWAVTDAPARYIDGQLRAIVGIELRITRIEGKSKLSQNRSDADQDGVISGLGQSEPGQAQLAEAMLGQTQQARAMRREPSADLT